MKENLFHSYVVSGAKNQAKQVITDLLSLHDLYKKNSADCIVNERVTFSIDDARELKEWQALAPSEGHSKVYILYTDFITREAENALLKTFEEPTPGTHIFFSVPNSQILLPTLMSRVRHLEVGNDGDLNEAKKFLSHSVSERLIYISELIEKGDDDDASAIVRQKAISFLNSLEKIFSSDAEKNFTKLGHVLKFKKYLQVPGASTKMILETLALTI
jgi:DNA polymerase III delta prime subunit